MEMGDAQMSMKLNHLGCDFTYLFLFLMFIFLFNSNHNNFCESSTFINRQNIFYTFTYFFANNYCQILSINKSISGIYFTGKSVHDCP